MHSAFQHVFYAAALTILMGALAPAKAEVQTYGSLRHYSDLPNILFLVAEIKDGDSFDLRRAMRDHDIEVVVTASPGGNLFESLQMAAILNDNSVGTYLPEAINCESACATIFLGGKKRMLIGQLGVHQFYSGSDDASGQARKDMMTSATQYTTAEVIGILNQFDTPPFVFEKMFGTEKIYYFRGLEKRKLSKGDADEAFINNLSEVDGFLAENPGATDRFDRGSGNVDTDALTSPSSPSEKTPSSRDGDKLFSNYDFFGMDLNPRGIRNVSLPQCERYCRENPACAAFSYVHKTRWCWPKSGVENISIADSVTSGIIDYSRVSKDIFDRPFIEATALDIPGYDLYPKGLRQMTLDQCRHACLATNNCVGFSYVPKRSWCFPKYDAGGFEDQIGIISGIVNR